MGFDNRRGAEDVVPEFWEARSRADVDFSTSLFVLRRYTFGETRRADPAASVGPYGPSGASAGGRSAWRRRRGTTTTTTWCTTWSLQPAGVNSFRLVLDIYV